MTEGRLPDALAAYLGQLQELGIHDLFMDSTLSKEALASAERGRAARGPSSSSGEDSQASRETPPAGGTARRSGPEAWERPQATPVVPRVPVGEGEALLPVLPEGYEEVRSHALACTRCRLAGGRTQVVFSDGNPDARLMVVGEAPGAREDETGLPFVGPAGQLLDLLLATIGLSRLESVYICNVLKCRPPGNRNPLPDEIEACSPYLLRQIELVRPEAILAVGTFSAQLLTAKSHPLGRLRGEVYNYGGAPLIVTYHPAALLRNAGWTRATWDDLQLLRSVMDRVPK